MILYEPLIITGMPFEGNWIGSNCKIEEGVLTIFSGFVWNGLNFVRDGKRNDLGLPYTWMASCLHDCLYGEKNSPLSRKQVDKLFYRELKKINFSCSTLYYVGVRMFGWWFYEGVL